MDTVLLNEYLEGRILDYVDQLLCVRNIDPTLTADAVILRRQR